MLTILAFLAGALGGAVAHLVLRAVERRQQRRQIEALVAVVERQVAQYGQLVEDSRSRFLAALRRESMAPTKREVGH